MRKMLKEILSIVILLFKDILKPNHIEYSDRSRASRDFVDGLDLGYASGFRGGLIIASGLFALILMVYCL